jgi:hypothetical protein
LLYKVLNFFLEKKISKLRPIIKKMLTYDLQKEEGLIKRTENKTDVVAMDFINADDMNKRIELIKKRLQIDNKYVILSDYVRTDSKRQYMINQNYYKYLEAIKYLYTTADIMAKAGVLTAPSEIYFAINAVEKSIDELIEHYGLTI